MNSRMPCFFPLLSLCLLSVTAVCATADTNRPNIVLCMTNDQGWGDTSYNGHPELKTPNLDAMAAAGILEWPARVPRPVVTSVPACTMDFYPTALDLLGIEITGQVEPINGIRLLPLIDGKMARRPKPIPLVFGQQVRLIDNEYILQKGRLFRFSEGGRKDVDVTDEEPEVFKRLTAWEEEWRETVKRDQAVYTVKRR